MNPVVDGVSTCNVVAPSYYFLTVTFCGFEMGWAPVVTFGITRKETWLIILSTFTNTRIKSKNCILSISLRLEKPTNTKYQKIHKSTKYTHNVRYLFAPRLRMDLLQLVAYSRGNDHAKYQRAPSIGTH